MLLTRNQISTRTPEAAHGRNARRARLGEALASHGLLIGILTAALILRLALSVYLGPRERWADAAIYDRIGTSLASGNGYSLDGIEPTRLRPPTYPAFLAVIYYIAGRNLSVVTIVQSILGMLTVLLSYLLACRVFGRRAGWIVALIVASYPALIYYDTRILREGPTAMLLTATVLLAIHARASRRRSWRLLSVGALMAVLSMCRLETTVLAVPVGYLLVRPIRSLRSLVRPMVLLGLPVLIVWTSWTVRNYVTFGSLSPVTTGLGSMLWFGSRWAEIGGDSHTEEARQELKRRTKAVVETADEADIDRRYMAEALRDVTQRPGWFIRMVYGKMVLFWKDANGVRKTLPAIHPVLAHLLNGYYYALLCLAAIGVAFGWRRYEWVPPLFGIIITHMMIYALLHVRNRYRVPVLPLVFVLSAGGFLIIRDFLWTWAMKRVGGPETRQIGGCGPTPRVQDPQ